MKISIRALALAGMCALVAATASAQSTSDASRPATTTASGDTGLWYVPTAETLDRGKVAVSGYRESTNYEQGFSNVADFAATFAVGLSRRVELFGSWKLDTRIDRDLRPLFTTNADVGGVIAAYPFLTKGWSGDNIGDALAGLKINLSSEADQKAVAFAIRGAVKIPTGKKSAGVSTGKPDEIIDLVISKDAWKRLELSGYAGGIFRGKAD